MQKSAKSSTPVVKPRRSRDSARSLLKSLRWKSRSCLGMDIGQHETKLVWVRTSRSGLQVSNAKFTSFPLRYAEESIEVDSLDRRAAGRNPFRSQTRKQRQPESQDSNRRILEGNGPWVQEEISKLMERAARVLGTQISKSEVAVNLSMEICDIRGVCLPANEPVTEQAIQRSLQESSGDDRPSAFALLPNAQEDNSKQRVFCVPSETTFHIASSLEKQNLRPRKIDGLPWCKLRLLEMAKELPANQVVPILDWSYGSPLLTLIADNDIKYVRRLTQGGMDNLLAAAGRGFGMDPMQARRWLELCFQEENDQDPCASEMRQLAAQCCQQIAREVETAIDFVRWQSRDSVIDKLLVIGGGGSIPGLYKLLQKELCLQVDSWNLKIANTELSSEYAVAASLALSGVEDG